MHLILESGGRHWTSTKTRQIELERNLILLISQKYSQTPPSLVARQSGLWFERTGSSVKLVVESRGKLSEFLGL